MAYYTYLLRCCDGSLYTGITTDLERRFNQHSGGGGGAKYTASHKPVRMECAWISQTRSSASKLEYRIKKLSKTEKELLVSGDNNPDTDAYTRVLLTTADVI